MRNSGGDSVRPGVRAPRMRSLSHDEGSGMLQVTASPGQGKGASQTVALRLH